MPRQEVGFSAAVATQEQDHSSVPDEEAREQLRRILASTIFSRSNRLSRFLTFIVEQTLEGNHDRLKEYQVGVEVCDRRDSYDPRTDPVVRVEARRLRSALDSYYAKEGQHDPVVISLPKGGYVPCFTGLRDATRVTVPHAKRRRSWRRFALAGSLVSVAVFGYLLWWVRDKPHLTDKDTVVLADFVNNTGDPVFDDTLRHGLSVQLEQSPFLNLLSEAQTAQAIALMGRSKESRLIAELARQVCERTGSTATIEGSISSLGSQYVLGLKSVNCHNGDLLAEAQATAIGKEKVLTALGAASAKLREQLGESLASVQKFDAPPENVTTPSLEALQAYSLGFKVHVVSFDEAGAATLFQRAVTLDPSFAMAYARLATCYANLGEFDRAAESMRKAYALRDQVSEREQLFILSMYHELVTGDLEAARKTYELRAQIYPRDDIPIGNLGNVYFSLGKYDKALAATQEALRRNPGSRIWYGNLVSSYIAANQLQQARATVEEARARQLDSTWLHLCLYLIDFQQRDTQGMEHESALLKDEPGFEDVSLYYQSQAAAYAGQWNESRILTRRAVEAARHTGSTENSAFYLAEASVREAMVGNIAIARRQAGAALDLSRSRDTVATAGMALAISGDSAKAMGLANDLDKRFPKDTLVQNSYIPMIRAAGMLHGKASSTQYGKAVETLAVTLPYEFGSQSMIRVGFLTCYAAYFRGEAYLASKQGALAAAEFQKILNHPQLTLTDPIGALAYLSLARAFAISGDHARSRSAYATFFLLWKNASPDIAIMKQSVGEARLQQITP
jgi:tetratricopeptide (TPR) repeat protein